TTAWSSRARTTWWSCSGASSRGPRRRTSRSATWSPAARETWAGPASAGSSAGSTAPGPASLPWSSSGRRRVGRSSRSTTRRGPPMPCPMRPRRRGPRRRRRTDRSSVPSAPASDGPGQAGGLGGVHRAVRLLHRLVGLPARGEPRDADRERDRRAGLRGRPQLLAQARHPLVAADVVEARGDDEELVAPVTDEDVARPEALAEGGGETAQAVVAHVVAVAVVDPLEV